MMFSFVIPETSWVLRPLTPGWLRDEAQTRWTQSRNETRDFWRWAREWPSRAKVCLDWSGFFVPKLSSLPKWTEINIKRRLIWTLFSVLLDKKIFFGVSSHEITSLLFKRYSGGLNTKHPEVQFSSCSNTIWLPFCPDFYWFRPKENQTWLT